MTRPRTAALFVAVILLAVLLANVWVLQGAHLGPTLPITF